MARVSIDIFSKNVFEKIQSNNYIYSNLSTKLFIIWYARFIIFCNYILTFDEKNKLKILKYIFENSPQDPSFFWKQSSYSIYEKSLIEKKTDKNHQIEFVFKNLIRNFKKIKFYSILLFKINLKKNLLLFCSRRICSEKVEEYFASNTNKKITPFPVSSLELKSSSKEKKFKKETEELVTQINKEIKLSLQESYSTSLNSDNDCFISEECINLSMDLLSRTFPRRLFFRKSKQSKFLQNFIFNSKIFKNITLIDNSAEILRNEFLFSIALFDNFNAFGYQHGGQYGEIRSINCAFEINSPVYNLGFLGWGFNLKKANFRMERTDMMGFLGDIRGILYPKSNNAFYLDNKKENFNSEKIENDKVVIQDIIKNSGYYFWIKPHPKSNDNDLSNVKKLLNRGNYKPSVDPSSVSLVILDSPGQTIMYDCVDKKVPHIYCFSLSAFELTDSALKYYKKLDNLGLYINSDIIGFEKLLEKTIKEIFS
tara:strand:- start:1354 stop:2799 length:1446 start_codon:yes stop_codon:yes gene_type:complete